MISPTLKTLIQQVVNVFETGSTIGCYDKLVKYADHKDPLTGAMVKQVTYGRAQATEFGRLEELIQSYVRAGGSYAAILQPYISRIGKMPALAADDIFCHTLVAAGSDQIMKYCQDAFFDQYYYNPALTWFTQNGFNLPLSLLTVYDSTVHSGSMLPFLCRHVQEPLPISGGNEKQWVTQYLMARNKWLQNNSRPLLQKTVYRTTSLLQLANGNNWDLDKPFNIEGVAIITALAA